MQSGGDTSRLHGGAGPLLAAAGLLLLFGVVVGGPIVQFLWWGLVSALAGGPLTDLLWRLGVQAHLVPHYLVGVVGGLGLLGAACLCLLFVRRRVAPPLTAEPKFIADPESPAALLEKIESEAKALGLRVDVSSLTDVAAYRGFWKQHVSDFQDQMVTQSASARAERASALTTAIEALTKLNDALTGLEESVVRREHSRERAHVQARTWVLEAAEQQAAQLGKLDSALRPVPNGSEGGPKQSDVARRFRKQLELVDGLREAEDLKQAYVKVHPDHEDLVEQLFESHRAHIMAGRL